MNEPRTWLLHWESFSGFPAVATVGECPARHERVEVIEKSAYDAVVIERDTAFQSYDALVSQKRNRELVTKMAEAMESVDEGRTNLYHASWLELAGVALAALEPRIAECGPMPPIKAPPKEREIRG